MRAGSLRHLVTIQRPQTVKQGGAQRTDWVDVAQVHCSIEQLKPYEKAAVATTWPAAEYQIIMRYRPGITGNMRVVDANGIIYPIVGVPNDIDGRHRELQLLCESGVKA